MKASETATATEHCALKTTASGLCSERRCKAVPRLTAPVETPVHISGAHVGVMTADPPERY